MARCHMIRRMKEDRKPQTADKYIVRFPDGMRDRIKADAEREGRSLNAQIIHMLNEFYLLQERERQRLDENAEDERLKGLPDAQLTNVERMRKEFALQSSSLFVSLLQKHGVLRNAALDEPDPTKD